MNSIYIYKKRMYPVHEATANAGIPNIKTMNSMHYDKWILVLIYLSINKREHEATICELYVFSNC